MTYGSYKFSKTLINSNKGQSKSNKPKPATTTSPSQQPPSEEEIKDIERKKTAAEDQKLMRLEIKNQIRQAVESMNEEVFSKNQQKLRELVTQRNE